MENGKSEYSWVSLNSQEDYVLDQRAIGDEEESYIAMRRDAENVLECERSRVNLMLSYLDDQKSTSEFL